MTHLSFYSSNFDELQTNEQHVQLTTVARYNSDNDLCDLNVIIPCDEVVLSQILSMNKVEIIIIVKSDLISE